MKRGMAIAKIIHKQSRETSALLIFKKEGIRLKNQNFSIDKFVLTPKFAVCRQYGGLV
jgi:hypothetical protein